MRADRWDFWLEGHPDPVFASELGRIIIRGAKLGYRGPPRFQLFKSHPSALSAPDILIQDLQKQQLHNRLTRIDSEPLPPFISSPLGLVPKSDGGWRRIHDLSYPRGRSVNDGIPDDFGALEYASLDDAISALLLMGTGAILVKRDLSDAFRHVPVASSDFWLLGFFCDGLYWIDRFLPFGLRTAPFLFDLFAKGLHWILIAVLGWAIILHYLDDFFAVLPPGADHKRYGEEFDWLCDDLGLTVNTKKSSAGTTAEFLGIELDSLAMEARLPPAKLQRARDAVAAMLAKDSTPYADLESLAGFLSFAARVIIPGRAFLRRIFDALRKKVARIHLNSAIKADLRWWSRFLVNWNGIRLLKHYADRPIFHIWTDASGSIGLGGFILGDPPGDPPDLSAAREAFSIQHSTRWKDKDIQFKETMAILCALRQWRSKLAGARVFLYCDNEAVVAGITHSSIRGQAMAPLRDIVLTCALHDILLHPRWLSTKDNYLADDLSRRRLQHIANMFPQLNIALQIKA